MAMRGFTVADLVGSDGHWRMVLLVDCLPYEILQRINVIAPPNLDLGVIIVYGRVAVEVVSRCLQRIIFYMVSLECMSRWFGVGYGKLK